MECYHPRIIAKGCEGKIVFWHEGQNCHSAGRRS